MKVDQQTWQKKLDNLHSRPKGITSENQVDYKNLLKLVSIGKNVLDVGCGTCWLRKLMPIGTEYTGMDAYGKFASDMVVVETIEHSCAPDGFYDTIFVFAALDGMKDIKKAIEQMKRIARNNIVILTGINIEPDLYHTVKITEEFLNAEFQDWKLTVRKQVHEKIIFLEYTK